MPKVFSKCLITRSLNSPEVSLIALNIKIGGRRVKHNFRTQLPPVVFRAIVLEQKSAAYTLGTYLTEQGAADRLDVCRRGLNPNCSEQFWMWIETVKDGIVIARRDVPVVTESQRNEVYATA